MIRISTSPFARSIGLVAGGSLAVGLVSLRFDDEYDDVPGWVYIAAGFAFMFAVLWTVLKLMYPVLEWDPEQGLVRLGGRTVPLASVTRATRSVSNAAASYLTYRFHSSEGPSARVLVAGRPLRGLAPEQLQELAKFVAALPVPDTGLSARQDLLASDLQTNVGAGAVSPAALLAELGAILEGTGEAVPEGVAAAVSASGRPAPEFMRPVVVDGLPELTGARLVSMPQAQGLAERWAADDEDAARLLLARFAGQIRTVRTIRVLNWISFVLSSSGLVIGIVQTATEGIPWAFLLLPLWPVLWFSSTVAHDRLDDGVRATGREWLAAGDDARRARGLATPFIGAFESRSWRAKFWLSYSGIVLATLLVIAGIALIAIEPLFAFAGIGVLVLAAAAATAGGVGLWLKGVGSAEAATELVRLLALRLDPPALVEEPPGSAPVAAAAPLPTV
ncbi:hypothetical protein [Agromyces seonyuensis]|uniref:Uncharacterized protein n=1 Tax=Agromyces seonyuensis TaxID=2662446 RepID=A0A6I4P1P5_9MICO|nr:hypothetical protein [Agromyces seonyuensis]MWB97949.1 hypothetical protein [Agromyces seonyuensis]